MSFESVSLLAVLKLELASIEEKEKENKRLLYEFFKAAEEETGRPEVDKNELFVELENESQSLMFIIEKTLVSSNLIIEKVRELDAKESNYQKIIQTLSEIKQINTLNSQIMSLNSLKEKTMMISEYPKLNLELIRKIYEKTNVTDSNEFELTRNCPVKEYEKKKNLILDDLIDQFDQKFSLELFKMFPLLSINELGLDKYSCYICSLISNNANMAIQSAVDQDNTQILINHLTKLYEDIATMIDNERPMVEEHYEKGSMLYIITRLKRESDIQTNLILNKFIQMRKLNEKISFIQKNDKNVDETNDSREFDMILGDLATICNQQNLFERFLKARISETHNSTEEIYPKQSEIIQTIINYFITFCQYFVQKSFEKVLKTNRLLQLTILKN
jgi:hypothetical protein